MSFNIQTTYQRNAIGTFVSRTRITASGKDRALLVYSEKDALQRARGFSLRVHREYTRDVVPANKALPRYLYSAGRCFSISLSLSFATNTLERTRERPQINNTFLARLDRNEKSFAAL